MEKYKIINSIEIMLLTFDKDTLKAIEVTLRNILKGAEDGRNKK